ncbi:MAG: GTP-binding protein [Nitrospirales bacterium]|nr:GTP-binding protein [Nitrospirales bacterium]
MKTTVVCGLLGSGKTTFIQGFLNQFSEKTVILVNDFAKAGIDGEIISISGVETIELPSGCICCTLKFDLISTIQKVLKEFSPGHLVIEPSGVAGVSGVLEVLDLLKIHPVTVVGVIDSAEFLELYESGMYGSFFEDQIRNSDIILINKVDLAPEEAIERTAATVEGINPGALIYRTVRARLDGPLPAEGTRGPVVKSGEPVDFQFDTVSVTVRNGVDLTVLQGAFEDIARGEYGDVVRAKALIQTSEGPFKFDLVYGKVDRVPFDTSVSRSRLVVIGKNLKKDSLTKQIGVPHLFL